MLDLVPNWAKILDPDPNSMYFDPKNCTSESKSSLFYLLKKFRHSNTNFNILWSYIICSAGIINKNEKCQVQPFIYSYVKVNFGLAKRI